MVYILGMAPLPHPVITGPTLGNVVMAFYCCPIQLTQSTYGPLLGFAGYGAMDLNFG